MYIKSPPFPPPLRSYDGSSGDRRGRGTWRLLPRSTTNSPTGIHCYLA